MTDLHAKPRARKILSLKKDPPESRDQPEMVQKSQAYYMVWCEGGDMPKYLYGPKQGNTAISHAKKLCEKTGKRFHVMRSYRAFEKGGDE